MLCFRNYPAVLPTFAGAGGENKKGRGWRPFFIAPAERYAFSVAFTRSGVNGMCVSRLPVSL